MSDRPPSVRSRNAVGRCAREIDMEARLSYAPASWPTTLAQPNESWLSARSQSTTITEAACGHEGRERGV